MKAVVLTKPTPAEEVRLTELPIPEVRPGWVLVKVKAFGMNHSEQILRLSEIEESYIQRPIVPGIECVGEVVDPSDSGWAAGQKVAALMGGMGRSFHGSYAEYALLPVHHVFPVESNLSWVNMAAVPETYFTAWGSLFQCLRLTAEDTLLIRGATCALGYAAIQIAKALGSQALAATHKAKKLPLLASADRAIQDGGTLKGTLSGITKVLEPVGPKTLRDSLQCAEEGGLVCSTGILGGEFTLDGFDPIKGIPNGVFLTGFFSNFPSREIMRDIFAFLEANRLTPLIGAVYGFDHIREACVALDHGKVSGKIVVTLEG